MKSRTINRVSKLLIQNADLYMSRMGMVLSQEFQLEFSECVADQCLTESIAMELLVLEILLSNQCVDGGSEVVKRILNDTEAYYRKQGRNDDIGERLDACFRGARRTYPIHESIFSSSYHVSNYLPANHPAQRSIMNHFMERIADLIDIPDMLEPFPMEAPESLGQDASSPRFAAATVKAVIGYLADNHMKHLLIKKPLKKLLAEN